MYRIFETKQITALGKEITYYEIKYKFLFWWISVLVPRAGYKNSAIGIQYSEIESRQEFFPFKENAEFILENIILKPYELYKGKKIMKVMGNSYEEIKYIYNYPYDSLETVKESIDRYLSKKIIKTISKKI